MSVKNSCRFLHNFVNRCINLQREVASAKTLPTCWACSRWQPHLHGSQGTPCPSALPQQQGAGRHHLETRGRTKGQVEGHGQRARSRVRVRGQEGVARSQGAGPKGTIKGHGQRAGGRRLGIASYVCKTQACIGIYFQASQRADWQTNAWSTTPQHGAHACFWSTTELEVSVSVLAQSIRLNRAGTCRGKSGALSVCVVN